MSAELELTSWRRMTSELYAAVRAEDDPQRGHALWRRDRDELFRSHPQSPLPPGDPLRTTGLPYWPYDPGLRFEVPLLPAERAMSLSNPDQRRRYPDGPHRLRAAAPAAGGGHRRVVAAAVRRWPVPAAARWHRGPVQLRRRPVHPRYRQGRGPWRARRPADHRPELPLPPLVPVQRRVAVPASPAGEHHQHPSQRWRAPAALICRHARWLLAARPADPAGSWRRHHWAGSVPHQAAPDGPRRGRPGHV